MMNLLKKSLFGFALFIALGLGVSCTSGAGKNSQSRDINVLVRGAVSAPGVRYFLAPTEDNKPTLSYAVALSGQPAWNANLEDVVVRRVGFWGREKTIHVNLLKILRAEHPDDFTLKDGDIIEIATYPTEPKK